MAKALGKGTLTITDASGESVEVEVESIDIDTTEAEELIKKHGRRIVADFAEQQKKREHDFIHAWGVTFEAVDPEVTFYSAADWTVPPGRSSQEPTQDADFEVVDPPQLPETND